MADHVCPVWVGYLLASPIRKYFQHPQKILKPYVEKGMTVMDIGSAMGFFTLPMAHMVKEDGRVICLDVQDKMLMALKKKALNEDVFERIDPRLCSGDDIGITDLESQVDFALAFAVLHEIRDVPRFFLQLYPALKPNARVLIAEPKGHVSESQFSTTLSEAEKAGFLELGRPPIFRSRTALLQKKGR
ncbi:MAG: methyltransferase domain-containing protein [Candidatus Magnetomorum sp.]|nr:methyltransferase domain-containing protein [Candidatus Magnetomorum sp.]